MILKRRRDEWEIHIKPGKTRRSFPAPGRSLYDDGQVEQGRVAGVHVGEGGGSL